MVSVASRSRSSYTLEGSPSAFPLVIRSVSMLVRRAGSAAPVWGCSNVFGLFGGETVHLLQIQLSLWSTAIAAIASYEQDFQQLHKRRVIEIVVIRFTR